MPEKAKADLDKLDTLRDLALCGPEDKREESQRAYEELRSELLVHDQCKACEDDTNTKELTMKDKDNETAKQYTKEKETIYDWDSNRDLENPDNIAWPKENEAKD